MKKAMYLLLCCLSASISQAQWANQNGVRVYTNEANWRAALMADWSVQTLVTTGDNIALADEVSSVPGENEKLGSTLTFDKTNTGFDLSFEVQATQSDNLIFNDNEGSGEVWDNALSVGDIDNDENDNVLITVLGSDTAVAAGFKLIDNEFGSDEALRVSDTSGTLAEFDTQPLVGGTGSIVFLGVISAAPFNKVWFNEANTGDDMAVADFSFVHASATTTNFPPLPQPTTHGISAGQIGWVDDGVVEGGWEVFGTTSAPYDFTSPGVKGGDIELRIDGKRPHYNWGVPIPGNWDDAPGYEGHAKDNTVAMYMAENSEPGWPGRTLVSVVDHSNDNLSFSTLSEQNAGAAVAFFPYTNGWTGATVGSDGSPDYLAGLPINVVVGASDTGIYTVSGLPTGGNMVAAVHGDGSGRTLSVRTAGNDWEIEIRNSSASAEDQAFSFVYIPTNALGIYSGRVTADGTVTALNDDLTLFGASCSVGSDGFNLTIGEGTLINPDTAVIFVVGDSTTDAAAKDNLWSYSANGNSFTVFSQDLPGVTGNFQAAGFRFVVIPFETYLASEPPPAVSITAPAGASEFVQGEPVSISADAEDSDGSVAKVEFFANGEKIGEDVAAPYELVWSNAPVGSGILSAEATDNQGYIGSSTEVAIEILPVAGTEGLYFDGIDDYVTFGDTPSLGLSNLTVECWFKREGDGQTASTGAGGYDAVPLVTKGRGESDGSTVDCNYFLGIAGDALVADFEDLDSGENHPVSGTSVITNGVWHHAAVTYDGDTWRLYLNGNVEAELFVGEDLRFDSIQHAGLAAALDSDGDPEGAFHGYMDEVRIWSVARSAEEIRTTMNSAVTDAPGLAGRWGLNEGSGTTVGLPVGTLENGAFWSAGASLNSRAVPSATPVAPAAGTSGLPLSVSLQAAVDDADSASVDVEFYMRRAAPVALSDFTMVALPDTQFYSGEMHGGDGETFAAQTDWCVSERQVRNIAFVTHLGDITETGDIYEWEWWNATNAMYRLEDPATTMLAEGIPYGVAVGNHDQAIMWDPDTPNVYFNKYFGPDHFAGKSYYGGTFDSGSADNNYQLFSAGGIDFILINFEYNMAPDQEVLDWGETLLETHSDRRAIIISHHMVYEGNPARFSKMGEALYEQFKDNRNVILMMGGHIHGEGRRSDTFAGHTIHSVLADFQGRPFGGSGWLRIIEVSPANNEIHMKTYSPTLGMYESDSNSEFTLSADLSGGLGEFALLGSVLNVATGTTATLMVDDGLEPGYTYEWYTVAKGSTDSIRSEVRTFSTGSSLIAPTVEITAPTNGAAFTESATITITADADDSDGTVDLVEFYEGTVKLGEDVSEPYSFAWSNLTAGSYMLLAKAIDDDGNLTTSLPVGITVSAVPSVSISVTDSEGGEYGDTNLAFALTRTGGDASALSVGYAVGGTVDNGLDIGLLDGSAAFAVGSNTAMLGVDVLPDDKVEGDEILVLDLLPGAGYEVVAPSNATVTITDRPLHEFLLELGLSDAGQDSDGDGIIDLTEYFMKTSPTNAADNARIVTEWDGSFKLRYPRGKGRDDVTAFFQWTTDITSDWHEMGESDGTVTITASEEVVSDPVDDPETMEVTVEATAGPQPEQIFIRMVVQ